MTRRSAIGTTVCVCLASASCGGSRQERRGKTLAGGLAIDPGGSRIADSLIMVAAARILSVAPRAEGPGELPGEVWNISGRFVIPAPVELGQGVRMPGFSSIEEARTALIKPPEAVEGIVSDADSLPPELLLAFQRAETIVVPRLARLGESPERLARGIGNVKALHEAGVRIASFGESDSLTEWKLLAQAGLSAPQVLLSATVHAARVARLQDSAGALRAGFLANLWVLKQDPSLSAANLGSVESVMLEGEWMKSPGAGR